MSLCSKHKKTISKFGTSNHKLCTETDRHTKPKTPLSQRICSKCNVIEDEVHSIIDCSIYDSIRDKYNFVKTGDISSVSHFINLLTGNGLEGKDCIMRFSNLATFIIEQAYLLRSDYMAGIGTNPP